LVGKPPLKNIGFQNRAGERNFTGKQLKRKPRLISNFCAKKKIQSSKTASGKETFAYEYDNTRLAAA